MHTPSRTPILDLEAPLPVRAKNWPSELRWWQTLLVLGGFFVVAPAIALAFMARPNPSVLAFLHGIDRHIPVIRLLDSINPYLLPLFCLLWLTACLFPGVVHEVAHLLTGMLVGFSPEALIVGPLRIVFRGAKPSFGFSRPKQPDGLCFMRIPTVKKLHRRLAYHIAAAPLANLVCGVGVTVGWYLGAFGWLPLALKALILGFGLFSIVLGLHALVPYRSSTGRFTDGARLAMLVSPSPKTMRWLSLIALDIQIRDGVPAKSWNRKWVRAASCINDGSHDSLMGSWLAFNWAEASDDDCTAASNLEVCLQNAGIASEEFLDYMRAAASAFHAWRTGDAVKAEKWFNAIQNPSSLPRLLQIRTIVALRSVEKRTDEALSKWDEGLALIKALPDPPRQPVESSWIEWRAEILKRCAPAGEPAESASTSPAQ